MIHGDKTVDALDQMHDDAVKQAELDAVNAMWDDPLGVLAEYFASERSGRDMGLLYTALTRNTSRSGRQALDAGRALAKLIEKARDHYISTRVEKILDEWGV